MFSAQQVIENLEDLYPFEGLYPKPAAQKTIPQHDLPPSSQNYHHSTSHGVGSAHQYIRVPACSTLDQFASWVQVISSTNSTQLFTCAWPGCQKPPLCATSGRVVAHLDADHRNESPFVCVYPNCGKVFSRQREADEHCGRIMAACPSLLECMLKILSQHK